MQQNKQVFHLNVQPPTQCGRSETAFRSWYRTLAEVAADLKISPSWLRELVRAEYIPVLRRGRIIRFDDVALRALEEALRSSTGHLAMTAAASMEISPRSIATTSSGTPSLTTRIALAAVRSDGKPDCFAALALFGKFAEHSWKPRCFRSIVSRIATRSLVVKSFRISFSVYSPAAMLLIATTRAGISPSKSPAGPPPARAAAPGLSPAAAYAAALKATPASPAKEAAALIGAPAR